MWMIYLFMCQDPPKYETLPLEASRKELKIQVTFEGETSECSLMFEQQKAYSLILYFQPPGIQCKLVSAPGN